MKKSGRGDIGRSSSNRGVRNPLPTMTLRHCGGLHLLWRTYSSWDNICFLSNYWVVEICSDSFNEKCFLTCLLSFTKPRQWQIKQIFHLDFNLDFLLRNITQQLLLCSIVTGDFNAWCSKWWKNNIINSKNCEIDTLRTTAGYKQFIDKPTASNSSSCIDLNFCNNQTKSNI